MTANADLRGIDGRGRTGMYEGQARRAFATRELFECVSQYGRGPGFVCWNRRLDTSCPRRSMSRKEKTARPWIVGVLVAIRCFRGDTASNPCASAAHGRGIGDRARDTWKGEGGGGSDAVWEARQPLMISCRRSSGHGATALWAGSWRRAARPGQGRELRGVLPERLAARSSTAFLVSENGRA